MSIGKTRSFDENYIFKFFSNIPMAQVNYGAFQFFLAQVNSGAFQFFLAEVCLEIFLKKKLIYGSPKNVLKKVEIKFF